jgi:ligand-binding sensor domain-containing protein
MMRKILSFLFLAGISMHIAGQKSDVRFHHIGVDEGLSHSLVFSIGEDTLGFIWFGTQDGLNRYDGYQFKTYFKGETIRDPSDSWISSLYIDSHQQMWIRYSGSGLDRYDPVRETFHAYRADSLKGSISSTASISGENRISSGFYEDRSGKLWIGTDKGLNRYLRESDSFITYRSYEHDEGTLSSDQIVSITGDRNGYLWIGTTDGLNRMDPETGEVTRFMAREGSDFHLNNNIINVCFAHPDGSLWVGTAQGGLNIIHTPDSAVSKVLKLIDVPLNPNFEPTINSIVRTSRGRMLVGSQQGLYVVNRDGDTYRGTLVPETRGIRIFHILEDSRENIWVSSNDNVDSSLFRMSPDLDRLDVFHFDEWDPYVFNGGKIQMMHESREGLLWIATEKDGIYMVDLYARDFRTIDSYRGRGLYISDNEVYSILEDDKRQLYVGTKTELNRINLVDGSWYGFHNRYNLKRNITYEYSRDLPATLIGAMTMDQEGRIWLGAFDYKVSLYDPARNMFLNFHLNDDDPHAFPLWSLRSILVTRDGQVYFGAAGLGLCRLRPDGLSFETLPIVATGDSSGLNDDHVQYMYEDEDGILWLGTIDGGLNRYDPGTGKFEHFVNDPSDKSSLSNNRVKCILEPEINGEDILWIGTNNGGLNRFDKRNRTFRAYTMKDGLPSNTIHGILEDKVGNLWMSTNRGLVQFDPLTERVIVYTQEDGLVGNEFNEGAFFKNREGILYFGGTNGINYFDPGQIKEKPAHNIPVVITNLTLAGEPVLPGDTIYKRIVLDRSVSFTDEITLTQRDRFVSFEFTSLHYATPRKIKYRYMLEGIENDWNFVDASQRYISYTNIPSGSYVLRLESTNENGNWSGKYTEVTLNILPPFWKTLLFKLIVVLLLVLGVVVIIRVRTGMLKAQKRTLERQVEERTRDLKEANRLLELKNRMTRSSSWPGNCTNRTR